MFEAHLQAISGCDAGEETPAITREPLGGTVATGVPCLLSAAVAGTGPLVCQWYVNGDPLLAANQPLLTIPLALPAH